MHHSHYGRFDHAGGDRMTVYRVVTYARDHDGTHRRYYLNQRPDGDVWLAGPKIGSRFRHRGDAIQAGYNAAFPPECCGYFIIEEQYH